MDEELSKAIEDGAVGPKADPKEPGGLEVWQSSFGVKSDGLMVADLLDCRLFSCF